MNEDEKIALIIADRQETESVDFKREFYDTLKNSDLPKDIAAFANLQSSEDRYLIFGVEDETRQLVGINEDSLPSQDTIDAYINQKIEPFVKVGIGSFEQEGKLVGYIKIHASNNNPPYVIKEACGPNNKIEKGDIYIRKGTCNQKATRIDIDNMYLNNGNVSVRVFDDFISIKPTNIDNDFSTGRSTYGHVDLEIYNETTRPYLFSSGYIEITHPNHKVKRRIISILPNRMIQENPLEIAPKTRRNYTALFDFTSQDCVDFGFNGAGYLIKNPTIQICLIDTDEQEYFTESVEALFFAKGEILHKVRLKEKFEEQASKPQKKKSRWGFLKGK